MPQTKTTLDNLCVNTLRMLSVDMVERAKSGHPGLPMGAAPMAYVLWTQFLRHNPVSPQWINRDRFVMSAGHGSALLYSLLHLTGYKIKLDDLKNFRQWGSITPGHPEYGLTPGVELTTGPLGQGFATGIGMALGERVLAERFNQKKQKIIGYNIFGIVSDGDLMEGISNEAASIAGNLKLNKIIYLYDSNSISIEGTTSLTYSEDVEKKYKALGWNILIVKDGNDLASIKNTITQAKKSDRPNLIIVKTVIGYGSPNKQDTNKAHGEPLGIEERKLTREFFNWPDKDFYLPEKALNKFRLAIESGKDLEKKWQKDFVNYKKDYPVLAQELNQAIEGELPKDWNKNLPEFSEALSTRSASGKVINALAKNIPLFIGGSADLAPSTKTYIDNGGDIGPDNYQARNIHFGVREHAMGATVNGLSLTPGIIPFGATFLVFSDYMRPSLRVAAIARYKSIFIFTHDSIAVGEDGPTHEPVEQIMSLRMVPNLTVIRPADANETRWAWECAVKNELGPTALVLSRQELPLIDQTKYAKASNLKYGAYTINPEIKKPDLILIATGSEVGLAISVAEILNHKKIRIVSMPSWEIFEAQKESYKQEVFPPNITKRISIEAGVSLGWQKYIGNNGIIIGVDRFGVSAKGEMNMQKFGFNQKNIIDKINKLHNL
ncbi:MAG: transketolase [Candidatus Falkowbacteria bacterium]|nr:transketolase [Candidatus Falkowbacteria bacterium]